MAIDPPETHSSSREFIRTHFLSLIFSDPASLHALVLVAAAHLARLHGHRSCDIKSLQLRWMAIYRVYLALMEHSSPCRAISDQLIIAVAKLPTCELPFGRKGMFHAHMTGLRRMVSLLGGLPELGLGGVLERMLLWIDANAACSTGANDSYFVATAGASSRDHPQADRRVFLIGIP